MRRRFETQIQLDSEIEAYFSACKKKKEMPTKGGMALSLETSRDVLQDYEDAKYDDQENIYSNAIKKAYDQIENAWVQLLQKQSVAGAIFYLKNAFKERWRDSHEANFSVNPIKIQIMRYGEGQE